MLNIWLRRLPSIDGASDVFCGHHELSTATVDTGHRRHDIGTLHLNHLQVWIFGAMVKRATRAKPYACAGNTATVRLIRAARGDLARKGGE